MSKFKGTGAAIVTPFKKDKSIDFDALERLINHGINGGLNFIVSLGTTGESATLSYEERKEVVVFTKKIIDGRIPLVVGIGGNNTNTVVNTIKSGDFTDVDAILSVSPYYNKPSQEGIYQHYKAVAEACPVDIILYNVPGRTSSNMSPETILRLANDFDNIIAVKEASGDLAQNMDIIQNKPNGFLVLSGDDNLVMPQIAAGMDGVISVAAQSQPKLFSDMVNAGLKDDIQTSRTKHYQLLDFMNAIFLDGNPGGIKVALNEQGILENELRLPLVPVNKEAEKTVRTIVNKLETVNA